MNSTYDQLSNFWLGKKVLVTGHTGFKGSWLAIMLHRLGANVSGISLEPESQENLFASASIESFTESFICDIANLERTRKIVQTIQPEFIFHLAAQSLVLESYRTPISNHSTNIMGTANMLEIIRESNDIKAAVFITTDKVYKMEEWVYPYRETDALGGIDPYSASKAACEILIESYRCSFLNDLKIPIASARAGNVIGGGDWSKNRLIPDAIKHWNDGKELLIRRPQAIRPWQHVIEPLTGYLQLAQSISKNPPLSGPFNFGPNSHDAMSVEDVIKILQHDYVNGKVKFDVASSNFHESGLLTLDISKAKDLLNFKPIWKISSAIAYTAKWYKSYYDGQNAYELCLADIEKYFNE